MMFTLQSLSDELIRCGIIIMYVCGIDNNQLVIKQKLKRKNEGNYVCTSYAHNSINHMFTVTENPQIIWRKSQTCRQYICVCVIRARDKHFCCCCYNIFGNKFR